MKIKRAILVSAGTGLVALSPSVASAHPPISIAPAVYGGIVLFMVAVVVSGWFYIRGSKAQSQPVKTGRLGLIILGALGIPLGLICLLFELLMVAIAGTNANADSYLWIAFAVIIVVSAVAGLVYIKRAKRRNEPVIRLKLAVFVAEVLGWSSFGVMIIYVTFSYHDAIIKTLGAMFLGIYSN